MSAAYNIELLAGEDSEQVLESWHVNSLAEVAQRIVHLGNRKDIPLDELGECTARITAQGHGTLTDEESKALMVLVEEFGARSTDEEIGLYRYLNPNRRS